MLKDTREEVLEEIMKYIKQFAIILTITFLSEAIRYYVPLQIPASIYGLIIMLVALQTKIIPLEAIKETSKFLLEIMPLMFIPAAVGLMDSWEVLRPICIPIIIITVVSTVVVMFVSGRVAQYMIRLEGGKKHE